MGGREWDGGAGWWTNTSSRQNWQIYVFAYKARETATLEPDHSTSHKQLSRAVNHHINDL